MDGKWKSIKTARQKSIPGFVPLQKSHGNYIDLSQKASANADYLANGQWKPPEPCPPKFAPRKIMTDDLHLDDSDFTLDELRTVLRSLKKNKATGPDDTSADLPKLFDDSNLQSVLLLPNDCWNRSSLPDDLEVARVY